MTDPGIATYSLTLDSTRGIEDVRAGTVSYPLRREFTDGTWCDEWMTWSEAMAVIEDQV